MGAQKAVPIEVTGEELLSAAAVRQLLPCTPATLRRLVATRKLSVIKVGAARPRFVRSEIEALKAASFIPALPDREQ